MNTADLFKRTHHSETPNRSHEADRGQPMGATVCSEAREAMRITQLGGRRFVGGSEYVLWLPFGSGA